MAEPSSSAPVSATATACYVGGALIASEILYRCCSPKRPHKNPFDKGVIYVFQFRRSPVIPSLSANCLALETWLRFAQIKYENVVVNPWIRSDEGLLPFIELNGVEQSGTNNTILWLAERFQVTDLEASAEAGDISNAETVAEDLLWCYYYFRYIENKSQLLDKQFIGCHPPSEPNMPWCSVPLCREMLKRSTKYGMGERDALVGPIANYMKEKLFERFKDLKDLKADQFSQRGNEKLQTLSTTLAQKQYIFGNKMSTTDPFVFAVLAQILYVPYKENPLKSTVLTSYQNLAQYCDRIKQRFWQDWEQIGSTGRMNTHSDFLD